MKTVACYTIRYRLNGRWLYSTFKMSLDFADYEYMVTQWEPLFDSVEQLQFNASMWQDRDPSIGRHRTPQIRSSAIAESASKLGWTSISGRRGTDKDWKALNAIWRRCKDRKSGRELFRVRYRAKQPENRDQGNSR